MDDDLDARWARFEQAHDDYTRLDIPAYRPPGRAARHRYPLWKRIIRLVVRW